MLAPDNTNPDNADQLLQSRSELFLKERLEELTVQLQQYETDTPDGLEKSEPLCHSVQGPVLMNHMISQGLLTTVIES